MDDVLRKKIEGQIDAALKADPNADMDVAFAAAGHVDLTIWRDMFSKRRVSADNPAEGAPTT
jgi:hypothetical protein